MVIYNWLVILIFALKDIIVIVSYGENINICYRFSPFTVGYNLVADTSEYLRLTAIAGYCLYSDECPLEVANCYLVSFINNHVIFLRFLILWLRFDLCYSLGCLLVYVSGSWWSAPHSSSTKHEVSSTPLWELWSASTQVWGGKNCIKFFTMWLEVFDRYQKKKSKVFDN